MKNKVFYYALFFAGIAGMAGLAYSCNDTVSVTDSKKLNLVADESYTLLMDTQVYMFESFHKGVEVHVTYAPESAAIQALLNDSAKVAIINRDLRPDERAAFKSRKIFPNAIKIAEDAIAFIVNRENTDTVFTVGKIKSILEGQDSLWSQLNKKSNAGRIEIVFDNPESANARYLKDSLLAGKTFPKNCFAVKSNPEVIQYVKEHKNALGVIGVNWISDQDDSLTRRFLTEIRVAGISRTEGEKACKPYQAYIKTKEYPFCRDVYVINRQTHSGLGMSFVGFLTGEKGQRMILKAGLIPATAPVRIIKINPGS